MARQGATTKTAAGRKVPPAAQATSETTHNTASRAVAKSAEKPKAVSAKAAPATVTSKHLAAALAERHDMQKREAEAIVVDVFARLVEHLKAGERVRIGGLGIMEVKNRPARMGRNPATGDAVQIKASRKVAFRAAKELKDAI